MRHIYRFAKRVVVWLGMDDEHTEAALDLVRKITAICCAKHNISPEDLSKNNSLARFTKRIEIDSLPRPNDSSWDALKMLFKRKWFQRLWVLQEVAINQRVTMCIGNREIDWDSVALTATWICALDDFAILDVRARLFTDGASSATLIRSRALLTTDWSPLLTLLALTRSLKATDPRDKVYAIIDHPSMHNYYGINFLSYLVSRLQVRIKQIILRKKLLFICFLALFCHMLGKRLLSFSFWGRWVTLLEVVYLVSKQVYKRVLTISTRKESITRLELSLLSPWRIWCANIAQPALDITPDYSLSTQQLFTEVAMRSIRQYGTLEILSHVTRDTLEQGDGFPS